MTDPYKVLGISPDATDDQVKTAYRELARKYHPDNYANNPLSDLAQEKMKEVNEAYEEIQKMRKEGGRSQRRGASQQYSSNRPSQFQDIRRMISLNRVTEAEEILDGVPVSRRDAEWHFLKGSVFYTRGWLDEAYNSFNRACQMDPYNQEYNAARERLYWQRQNGAPGGAYGAPAGSAPQQGGCSVCTMCQGMICMDMCCDCMGGM